VGRHKENYTKDETLKIYKELRLKFVTGFMDLYNKSPLHTKQMWNENFDTEELVGLDKMVRTLDKSFQE